MIVSKIRLKLFQLYKYQIEEKEEKKEEMMMKLLMEFYKL